MIQVDQPIQHMANNTPCKSAFPLWLTQEEAAIS